MSATILTAEVANGKIKETPGKSALSARVFQVDSVSSIWAQIGLAESWAFFDKYLDGINLTCEGFGEEGRGVAKPPPVDSMVALMDPSTGKWERARVTAVGTGGEFDAFLIDTGESRKGNVRNVCNRPVEQLFRMAAQAVQCRLVGIDPDMCSQHSAAQLKELFDRATEVKAEVFSVPRKQQCNAAFFVMINGQWQSVATTLNQKLTQGRDVHASTTKAEGEGTAGEATSPPHTSSHGVTLRPADSGEHLLEDAFAECALNEDAQQPVEPVPKSPLDSPPPPSRQSPTSDPSTTFPAFSYSSASFNPSHPIPSSTHSIPSSTHPIPSSSHSIPSSTHSIPLSTHSISSSSHSIPSSTSTHPTPVTHLSHPIPSTHPTPSSTHPTRSPSNSPDVIGLPLPSGSNAGQGQQEAVEMEGSAGLLKTEASKGTDTKEGTVLELSSSSDGEWDESLLAPHKAPLLDDPPSRKRFNGSDFARRVFGREIEEQKSKSKASFEEQFNQLMTSGSGRYNRHQGPKGKGRGAQSRAGGHRGERGVARGTGRGISLAKRPLFYGDEVETPSVPMVGVKVSKGPSKVSPSPSCKGSEETGHVEDREPAAPVYNPKAVLVLKSDNNDISWYSYRLELCVRKLLDSPPATAAELDTSIQNVMAEESCVQKLVKLAGNERVVFVIVKTLIHSAITKAGCMEVVVQAFLHFCNSGHLLSETPLFLLPAMDEITSDSLISSNASDTWKYRRSFSCFFTKMYLVLSQNSSMLTSTLDQLVHHYLDKWSNRSTEQHTGPVSPPSLASIECLVSLLEELGSVLDKRDRRILDTYFNGTLKDLILNDGLQRPAKEALYELALQRREWLAKNEHLFNLSSGQEKQQSLLPTPPPPPVYNPAPGPSYPVPGPSHPVPSPSYLAPGPSYPGPSYPASGPSYLAPGPSHPASLSTQIDEHQVLPNQMGHGNRFIQTGGNSTPHMTTHVANESSYQLVKDVLEELRCPEHLPKFIGACYTDVVLEGCDNETLWKGLKELGIPMGVAAHILATRQKRNKTAEGPEPAVVDTLWTSAQQNTSVVMTPQQYSLPYSGGLSGSSSVPCVLAQQMAPVYMSSTGVPLQVMPTNQLVPLQSYGGERMWKSTYQDIGRSPMPVGEGASPMSHSEVQRVRVGPQLHSNQQAPGVAGGSEHQVPLPPPQWRFGKTLCVVCGGDTHQSHSCPKRSEKLFVH